VAVLSAARLGVQVGWVVGFVVAVVVAAACLEAGMEAWAEAALTEGAAQAELEVAVAMVVYPPGGQSATMLRGP